jgi:hypothetical protein
VLDSLQRTSILLGPLGDAVAGNYTTKSLPMILNVGKRGRGRLPLTLSLDGDLADAGDTLLKIRTLLAFDRHAARYPIYRTERCAVRRPLVELLDDLALHSNFVAQRLSETSLLLDGPGVFVATKALRKIDYSSLVFDIWADSLHRLNVTRDALLRIAGEQLVRREMFTIDWHFSADPMGLESASFDEMADPPLLDEAYPMLGEPVTAFISRYLASRETVLILQGPPGTGKTRLVRAILAALSVRKAAKLFSRPTYRTWPTSTRLWCALGGVLPEFELGHWNGTRPSPCFPVSIARFQ